MIISSWNVNSVRARINNIIEYLKSKSPDILMIQEIKTENKNFPYEDFKNLGYKSYVNGQKSYNGMAFISKINLENINNILPGDKSSQSRIMNAELKLKRKIINLTNIYVPNGNPIYTEKYSYKKEWLNLFIKKLKKDISENKNVIIGGDFNIIPEENDVYDCKKYENDALFKLEIRKKFREIINIGFHDAFRHFNNKNHEYTFWDYQKGSWQKNYGMRIDFFLISINILNDIKNVTINKKLRSQLKPSDHVAIECEIN
jgi:exodeoxyribonuclease-3